ncbi:hypothetical protein M011DRAFT_391635, partial [Sporormia fimetaria CBS 119925]
CGSCGKSTTVKCARCKDVYYCNAECQKAHWKEHKRICDMDRYIRRVGALLQDLFFAWAEQMHRDCFVRIEDTGSHLIVYDGPHQQGSFYPFPNHLVKNAKDKRMILSSQMCDEALAYFKDLVDEMLKGTECKLHEFHFRVKIPRRRTKIITVHGEDITGPLRAHLVIAVSAKDNQKEWIIDPTGAQFSMFEAVMGKSEYEHRYVDKVLSHPKWGYTKKKFEAYAKERGYAGLMARISFKSMECIHQTVLSWKTAHGDLNSNLFRATDPVFQDRK